jgi:hypothetical protein
LIASPSYSVICFLVGVSGPEFWKSGKEPEFLYVCPELASSGDGKWSVCPPNPSGSSLEKFWCTWEYQRLVCRDRTENYGCLLGRYHLQILKYQKKIIK